jgi:glycosyltransferase domain-containing protein
MSTREVKTPYVCFLSDDEFFIPNVLLRMISYLDMNQEFVSVGAGCASFNLKNQFLELKLKYDKMKIDELELPNIKLRLKYHFQDYLPRTIYGVHRSEIWRNAVSASDLECNIPDRAFEIIFEFMIVAQGKVKILPEIHWLRSTENLSISAKVNSEFDFFIIGGAPINLCLNKS